MKTTRIAFFDTKPFDQEFFDAVNTRYGYSIKYYKYHLNPETASLTGGYDVVCAFVNDVLNAGVIDTLAKSNIRLIALRCAGYNNVDFKAAFKRIHVVRVPAYSPHAVAEHTVALMLTLNRKTHRAYF
jgi:D-lactate dehydrogenase